MKSLRQEAKASHDAKLGRMGVRGYADGGFVPPKVGSNDRLPVANVIGTKAAGKIGGGKAKDRLDRPNAFAAGGRAKSKNGKTNVTVIVAPGGGPQPGANPAVPPMPPPAGGPAPMPPPRPPMLPPPAPPGAGPAGGMPPSGMPIRARGGRVKKDDWSSGGGVKSVGMNVGTKVSHSPGRNQDEPIYSKPPALTRASGGRAYLNLPDDGAGSGPGREEKIGMQKKFKGPPARSV